MMHQIGQWVIVRSGPRPSTPWKVILWGGNGEHWADGAEVGGWTDAVAIVDESVTEYRQGLQTDKNYALFFEWAYVR